MIVKRIGHNLSANNDYIYCVGGKTNDEGNYFHLMLCWYVGKYFQTYSFYKALWEILFKIQYLGENT